MVPKNCSNYITNQMVSPTLQCSTRGHIPEGISTDYNVYVVQSLFENRIFLVRDSVVMSEFGREKPKMKCVIINLYTGVGTMLGTDVAIGNECIP